jgi:hypothetical protein
MYSRQTIGTPSANYTTGLFRGPGSDHLIEPEKAQSPVFKPLCRYFICLDWLEITLKDVWFSPDAETVPSNSTTTDVRHRTPARKCRLSFPVSLNKNQTLSNSGSVEFLNNPKIKGPKSKHYRTGLHVLYIPAGSKRTANQRAEVAKYGVGFLSVSPNEGNNCEPGSAIFQAANPLLYRSDLWEVVRGIMTALKARHGHFTRVDIAIDTLDDVIGHYAAYWNDYHRAMIDPEHVRTYGMKGKVKSIEAPTVEGGKIALFHHGSAGSAKSLKGYRKGKRVKTENKGYIVDAWRRAGLIGPDDDGANVQRLEVTHRREAIRNIAAVDVETGELSEAFTPEVLDRPGMLAGIFRTACKGWFEILEVNPNDSNKSRWPTVPVIDWEALETAPVVRIPKTVNPSEVWRAKHASYKLARDAKVYDYPAQAVRQYLDSIPRPVVSSTLVDEYANRITTDRTGDEPLKTVLGHFAAAVVERTTGHVADWSATGLPEYLAEAMAQYHGVGSYLGRRLRKDNFMPDGGCGFTLPDSRPATCDACQDLAHLIAPGTVGATVPAYPNFSDLQSIEPGNKKGMTANGGQVNHETPRP